MNTEFGSRIARHLGDVWPYREIKRFTADPLGSQERLLKSLLQRAAQTEWGRRYSFSGLLDDCDIISAYQNAVPLCDYDAYRDDVKRARAGAADVFWPGKICHFAVSSGTISEGRIIPISNEMLHFDRRLSMTMARIYIRNSGRRDILRGKALFVPGRVEEDPENEANRIGEISGLVSLISPRIVQNHFEAVPREVLALPDWDEKLDAIVRATLSTDIRAIAMVPSWAVVLFKRLIARYNSVHGKTVTSLREIWPNLTVFFSGGVALSSYRDLIGHLIGRGDVDFVEGYGASEGFFSFQDRLDETDMLLHLGGGVFFEFVRADEQSAAPRRFTIADVEPDVRYQLYVTTCSGLWSYAVGDVIRFTSVSPHRIVVSGRSTDMMDTYGEAVYGDEARKAIEHACRETKASVRDFHIAPIMLTRDRMPGHQWLIEFEVAPPDLDRFGQALAQHLRTSNRHYVIRREAEAFTAPEIIAVADGTFYTWLKRNRKVVSAQTKVPRMSDERRIANEVLSISRNNT